MPFENREYNNKRKKALRQARKKRLRDKFMRTQEQDDVEELGQEPVEGVSDQAPVALADESVERVDAEDEEEPVWIEGDNYDTEELAAVREAENLQFRAVQQEHLLRVLVEEDIGLDVEEDGQVEPVGKPSVSREQAVEEAANFFVGLQARREVPHAVLRDIVQYLQNNASSVSDLLQTGSFPTYRSMRYKVVKNAPKVIMDVKAETNEGLSVDYQGIVSFPRKDIEKRGLKVIYTHYYVALEQIVELHRNSHRNEVNTVTVDMSLDGIPESKSSGLSIDVLSIRFHGCDNIYSVGIMHPAKKGLKGKDEILLRPLLADLQKSGVRVKRVIADAPKRAVLQGLKSHAATFGCHYCKASKVSGKFPSSTFGARLRTDGELRRVAEALEAGGEMEEDACGVKGYSPLKDVPGLDLVRDVPTEAMHLIALGVVRRMLKCTYNVGQKMAVAHKPADVEQLNCLLAKCKGLTNFNRQPRNFDPAVWKAAEYRNFVLAYWPVLLTTAPKGTLKSWLLTVYIVRGLCLPDRLYNELGREAFETDLFRRWYVTFEKAFGVDQCTYNPHNFTHLNLVRRLGPLSETSALLYEDHYAIIKQNYKAGTTSVGTQALQTSLISTMMGHRCKPAYRLKVKATSRVDDRYVYLNDGRIFLLTDIDEDDGLVRGRRVAHQRVFGLLDGLDMSDVLIFRVEANRISRLDERLDPASVLGNVVLVNGYGSVILWSMLRL